MVFVIMNVDVVVVVVDDPSLIRVSYDVRRSWGHGRLDIVSVLAKPHCRSTVEMLDCSSMKNLNPSTVVSTPHPTQPTMCTIVCLSV